MTVTPLPQFCPHPPNRRTRCCCATQAAIIHTEPDILQPAEPFLDLPARTSARASYLTTDPGGEELCSRPDLTIPVARDGLPLHAGEPAGSSYLGPVFRYRRTAERF
jgi:ATP phosphoribosyltransferase regulatory subunit